MSAARLRSDLPPIAPCAYCGRDIKHGRPYVMVRPGVFAHRGPCQTAASDDSPAGTS